MKKLLIMGLSIVPIMAIVTIEPSDIGVNPNRNTNLIDVS